MKSSKFEVVKVTYIISDINKALAFEWIAGYTDKEKISLSFLLLNPATSSLEEFLLEKGFEVYRISCSGKKDWLPAIFKTYRLLKKIKPHAVHCHLIQANIIGLTAAKLAGIKKRIYTRHHSSLHHVYFPKGVWWDKLSNKWATHIVAISGIVKKILVEWEGVSPNKVILVPHGFLLDHFSNISSGRIEDFKAKNDIIGKFPVGVISRFTEWKGIQFIIPAFKKFLENYPDAVLVLLNATGDYEQAIYNLLQQLPQSSYRVIKFEKDVAAAYKSMNVFVHVPIDEHSEAFGQTYVEALAAATPSIFTLSGIAPDFVKQEQNAYVVPFKDSEAIYEKMKAVAANPGKAKQMAARGAADVAERFSLQTMINALEKLYDCN